MRPSLICAVQRTGRLLRKLNERTRAELDAALPAPPKRRTRRSRRGDAKQTTDLPPAHHGHTPPPSPPANGEPCASSPKTPKAHLPKEWPPKSHSAGRGKLATREPDHTYSLLHHPVFLKTGDLSAAQQQMWKSAVFREFQRAHDERTRADVNRRWDRAHSSARTRPYPSK